MFPNPILQQIFSYLSLPDKLRLSRVSRKWHYNLTDPYLYQDIEFHNLEFNQLIQAMASILRLSPRIRSISIHGCHSDFIQNTVIPVQFSVQAPNRPLLFCHIRSLQPERRLIEYRQQGFDLHQVFSDLWIKLLELSRPTLYKLQITQCDLDLDMTELFRAIPGRCPSLQTLVYLDNKDKGLSCPRLLQAIVENSPDMKEFRGCHGGMNDAVLMSIARHWPQLESITLSSNKSNAVLELTGLVSENGHELRGASPTGTISSRAFWELLCKCKKLRDLDIHDLACVTNHHLTLYLSFCLEKKKSKRKTNHRFQPYTPRTFLPGSSLRTLRISKYITTPLSTPGFHDLLLLFPLLERFEYATNFHTFYNQFQGVTREMFDAEKSSVDGLMENHYPLNYIGRWDEPITTEQRLMAGITQSES